MVQTNRKTNVAFLAILMSFVLVFAFVAALFAVNSETDTAYALDDVAKFWFEGISGSGSKTNGGITFSYSGSYYIPGGTTCIVLEKGGSFTLTVNESALNNKNITKVKYSLSENYASGAGTGGISVRLKRGTKSKSTSQSTPGVDIGGSGNLTLTITNSSTSDRSKAYNFSNPFTLMAPAQVAVTVGAGTGVKEVFLSSAQSGSPVAASGSTFAENSTVYAFARLEKGYQSKNGWVKVSGNDNSENAVYRTGSKTVTTSNKDFGTIAADIKTRSLVLNGNGTENGTNINLTYGQTASVGVLSRSGYNFLGWNTNAEGTGETYGNSDGASLTVDQVNAILDDGSITAFYAMWKADTNTVIAYINAIGEVEYTQACKDKIDAARTLYDSLDTADQALVTNYTNLTDAEAAYALLKADNDAADAVDALIDAIGNPVTLADKDAINAAREAYDALTPAQKALLDDLAGLEAAEATYSELEAAYHAARALVGDGSLENPYLIERAEQLEHFRDIVLGVNGETQNSEACVVLTADIDLGGSVDNVWTPIGGQNDLAYLGTFDGQGHTITGLYVSGEKTIGLFGRVNSGAVVKNLTVYGTAIATNTGSYQGGVAGIVGYLSGSVINCHNYVNVSSTSTDRWKGYAGGIAGQTYSGSVISNCSNYGEIYSTSATVGGIVGQMYDDGTVTNSYNYAPVTGTEYVGGIAGSVSSDGTVSYCFNYGNVVATSCAPAGSVAGYSVLGGSGAATFGANYYLTGRLTVNNVAQNGGICAYNETTEDWDYKDIEGQLEPLTENEMRDQASFVGWDFDDVWTMGDDHPVFYDSGIRICGSIVDNFVTSGEGWSFDKATKTLTLTDFRFEGDGAIFGGNKNAVIFYQGTEGLNIVLVGENIIENTFTDEQKNIYGIYSNATLTIGGEGSLDVSVTGKGGHTYAIGSMSTLTLDAAAITATGGPARYNSIGLYAIYDGIFINSGAVTATGGTSDNNYSYGIWSYGEDASSGTAGTVIAKKVESVTAKGDAMAICWGVNTEIGGLGVEYDGQIASETEILPDNYVYSSNPIEGIFRLQEIRLIGITVDDVIALINAIPDPVVYTQACKDAIDKAREAYETLETDEKILITNYGDLTDAESIYNGMQSDKESLDLYKNTQKGEADDLALEGDSAACTDLISDAKDAIDALSYDCTKTLDENKAAVDKIIDDLAAALALQRDKDAFEAYKSPSKEAADELALESDSAACENLIANAKDAIDALNYNEEKTLTENKAIIDGMVDDLAAALALQRDKDAFEAYKSPSKEAADDLAEEGDSAACETLITNAKQAIDDIVYDCTKTLAENKALVDDIISALESDLYNQRQADGVAEYIDAISDPVTLASKPDINTARAQYNGLSDNQKTRVSNYDKLTDAEAALAVVELIDAIDESITSEDEETIEAARNAFNALTNEQQALVGNIDDLLDAEAALAVAKLIEAIEAPITSEDEEAIEAARNAYDDLDEDQQDLVGNYDDLTDAEAALAVAKLIDAIDEAITAEDEETIEAAREAFDALTDGQQDLVGNINDLTDAEAALAVAKLIEAIEAPIAQEDEEAIETAREAFDALTEDQQDIVGNVDNLIAAEVEYVKLLIDAIGDPVTLNDKEAIEAAREAFDALTEEQQALVDNVDKLIAAEVEYVTLLIDAIGTVEYTEDSKDKIDAAKDAFDALTDDQKALLENTDKDTLTEVIMTYEVLHENHVAAQEVIALIDAIGEVEYTDESKAKIDAAMEAFDALTDDQKAIVDKYLTENEVDEITVSETVYIDLGNQQKAKDVKDLINAIGVVAYPNSRDAIEAARAGYNGLTETQKTLVDNYEILTAAEVRFAELEKTPVLTGGVIAAIVFTCLWAAFIIFILVLYIRKRKQENK